MRYERLLNGEATVDPHEPVTQYNGWHMDAAGNHVVRGDDGAWRIKNEAPVVAKMIDLDERIHGVI